jgi:hypothetical protein
VRRLKKAEREAIAKQGPWRCFHCGELFEDQDSAAEHFGTDWFCEDDGAACIQILTEGEKAIVSSRREAGRFLREAEAEIERLEDEVSSLRWDTYSRFKGAKSADEAVRIMRDLEDRALTAEAALNAAPKWLRRFLRWKAEADWKRGRREMDRLRRDAEAIQAAGRSTLAQHQEGSGG